MFNCCRIKQHDNEKYESESIKPETIEENRISQEDSNSIREKMSPKNHVFHIFSSNHLKCLKKRTKNRLTEKLLPHNADSSVHAEQSSWLCSKMDESENLDSISSLPLKSMKYNVGKNNFHEADVNLCSDLLNDNNNSCTNLAATTATVATSRRGSLYIFRHSEDLIVTPFAQILASLRNVRANFMIITNAQSSREARFGSFSNSSQTVQSDEGKPEDERHKALNHETLEELEWCLERLESIQTHRSVSDMASSKFKKILNKELCQYADQSKSGNQISDYICTTFLDSDVDSTLDQTGDSDRNEFSRRSLSKTRNVTEATSADHAADVQSGSITSASQRGLRQILTDTENISNFGIISSQNEELVTVMENSLDRWGMDIFLVNTLSDNRPLTVISFALFRRFKLFEIFSILSSTFFRFITAIETQYHSNIPYHNSIHAADVTQSTYVLLGASSLENVFSDLEVMAVIFACIVHDVDHPGVTNQYLINTNDQLALLYNDSSVLENHHLSVAFTVLSKSNCDITVNLNKKQKQSFRKMVIDMVLATDMSKHMSLLAELKTMVETQKVAGSGILNLDNYTDRIQILQNMVHCADLSNPTKPLALYKGWTARIMEEFFQQGDKEKQKILEISPMCDRETATIEKSQVSFIDFIVHPLWETWSDLVYPEAQDILDTLEDNRDWYFSQIPKNEN